MPTITEGKTPYGTVLYATVNANVRNGPGVGYDAIATLKTGQQVTAQGSVTVDGEPWVTVAAGQWVSGKLLADKPPAASDGSGGGVTPPPYKPDIGGGVAFSDVALAIMAAAAGYAAYKWASKGQKGSK